jgi:hypothetical protein
MTVFGSGGARPSPLQIYRLNLHKVLLLTSYECWDWIACLREKACRVQPFSVTNVFSTVHQAVTPLAYNGGMNCDLHVHTRHSGPCTIPIARRLCCETYTEPAAEYLAGLRQDHGESAGVPEGIAQSPAACFKSVVNR